MKERLTWYHKRFFLVLPLMVLFFAFVGCSTGSKSRDDLGSVYPLSLDEFIQRQKGFKTSDSLYRQAELSFTAEVYQARSQDLDLLQKTWRIHSKTFPESPAFLTLDEELRKTGQEVVLISVYTEEVDRSDLRNKTYGWSLYPVPDKIIEISDQDQVMHTLFPMKNLWSKMFLLTYSGGQIARYPRIIVGSPSGTLELPLK